MCFWLHPHHTETCMKGGGTNFDPKLNSQVAADHEHAEKDERGCPGSETAAEALPRSHLRSRPNLAGA